VRIAEGMRIQRMERSNEMEENEWERRELRKVYI